MLKLIIIIISLNILVGQCHDKSKFPCINTKNCEWRTEILKGSCIELNQAECQSGKYNNCYWYYSFDGEEQCQGNNYTIFDGSCHETENILSQHINSSTDKYFENLLINSGFQLIELNNEKIFKKDEITLSYRDLQVTTSGIKFINPEIIIDENNGTLTELKFDSISVGVSMKQIIRLLEGLIYEERMESLDSFQFNFLNGYMSQINNNKYEPVGIIELSLNAIDFTFNGYLNQQMLDNIDKRGILPSLNQICNFKMKGLSLDRLIGKNGENLLQDPLKQINSSVSSHDFYKMYFIDYQIKYLPENNEFNMSLNGKHSYLDINGVLKANIAFNEGYRLENSSWKNSFLEMEVKFNFPFNNNINLKDLKEFQRIEFLLSKIPKTAKFKITASYNDDLIDIIKDIEQKENVQFDELSQININCNIDNFSIEVADIGSDNSPDYSSFTNIDVSSFSYNFNVSNSNLAVKSNLNTNKFSGIFNMNLNIKNMDNPYFNKFSFDMRNISHDMEKYIKLVEELNNIQFIRYYNNIMINMRGHSKTPVITGIEHPSLK